MITVKIIGGLGNQLFQYALGRHLAEIHNTSLALDITGYETYKLHSYSLWAFNIRENFASPEETASLTVRKQRVMERLSARLLHRRPKLAPTHIREERSQHYRFNPDILSLPDGVYLDGYWQTEKYFIDIAGIIRREASVKFSQIGKDKEIAQVIDSVESVSLHIRRGDYVSNPKTHHARGTCDLNHYFRCVEQLCRRVTNPHFFIFTDDPQWARDNLNLSYPTTFVDHNNADKNYEDLRLMSQCKHHIIANSSFSWWAAWLNPREDKMVFAPKRWLAASYQNCPDIVPTQWITL
jgi:hypothetical protein